MFNNKDFEDLLRLNFDKTKKSEALAALDYFKTCQGLCNGRKSHSEALVAEMKRKSGVLTVTSLSAGVFAVLVILTVVLRDALITTVPSLPHFVAVFCLILLVLSTWSTVLLLTASKVEIDICDLKPLNCNPERSLELKELCGRSAVAADYIRSVLLSNEEPTFGDLSVAKALEKGAKLKAQATDGVEICQELRTLLLSQPKTDESAS